MICIVVFKMEVVGLWPLQWGVLENICIVSSPLVWLAVWPRLRSTSSQTAEVQGWIFYRAIGSGLEFYFKTQYWIKIGTL